MFFFSIPIHPGLPAQIDRCGNENNDTQFNVLQVQISNLSSMVPIFFFWHSPLAWSSNNIKWDFMQDLLLIKWEKRILKLYKTQVSYQIFRHKAKTHFCSLQISTVCPISIVSNKGASKQHHCRSLELETFQNLKCEACGFLSNLEHVFWCLLGVSRDANCHVNFSDLCCSYSSSVSFIWSLIVQ